MVLLSFLLSGTLTIYGYDITTQQIMQKGVLNDVKELKSVYSLCYDSDRKQLYVGGLGGIGAWDLDILKGVCKFKGIKGFPNPEKNGGVIGLGIDSSISILFCIQQSGAIPGLSITQSYTSCNTYFDKEVSISLKISKINR
jgi:hypothetical protein